MDYKQHYLALITKYGTRGKPVGYSERHHVVPKSMGGTNDINNLMYLSAKAHFVAHHLLKRWHKNVAMNFAFHMLCTTDPSKAKERYKAPSLVYQEARIAHAAAVSASQIGRTHTEETKAKIAAAAKGRTHTGEAKAAISSAMRGNTYTVGLVHTEETKAKLSAISKGKAQTEEHKAKRADSRYKLVNIYCCHTDTVVAEGVFITSWCKENAYSAGRLGRTVRADRSRPSTKTNQHYHKGIYAQYI